MSGQFFGKFIVDRVGKTYLLLPEYIGIDVRCNTYVAVTEVSGDHFQVYSAVQQKGCIVAGITLICGLCCIKGGQNGFI